MKIISGSTRGGSLKIEDLPLVRSGIAHCQVSFNLPYSRTDSLFYFLDEVRDIACGFGGAPTKKSAQNEAARCAGTILQNPEILRVLGIKDPALFEREAHIITAALAETKWKVDLTDSHMS